MAKLVLFKFNIKDREYCNDVQEIYVDLEKTTVFGMRTIKVWNDHYRGMVDELAFYISYEGIEYGSFEQKELVFDCSCGEEPPVDDFMIFDEKFEKIFE